MDQVVSRLSLQTLQTVLYLELILSSQDLSDDCQGPDIVRGSVRTPNPTDFTTFEEVGIGFRENVSSRVDIDWVAFLNELKVRQRKQGRQIAIIECLELLLSVDFVGKDLFVPNGHHPILEDCLSDSR